MTPLELFAITAAAIVVGSFAPTLCDIAGDTIKNIYWALFK